MQYFGARYFDPRLGRFMGIDPAGFDPAQPFSFNRYAYANNNPYRYVDPDGRNPLTAGRIGWAVGAGIDALVYRITGSLLRTYLVDVAWDVLHNESADADADADGETEDEEVADDFDKAREKAFEKAGMTNPDDVEISKIDPETGTAVEFKGKMEKKLDMTDPMHLQENIMISNTLVGRQEENERQVDENGEIYLI